MFHEAPPNLIGGLPHGVKHWACRQQETGIVDAACGQHKHLRFDSQRPAAQLLRFDGTDPI
jgi:hypothetical protein